MAMTTKTRTSKPAATTPAAAELSLGMVASPRRTRI
jgi:hypothetical protein